MFPTKAGAKGHAPSATIVKAKKRDSYVIKHLRTAFMAGMRTAEPVNGHYSPKQKEDLWVQWAKKAGVISE